MSVLPADVAVQFARSETDATIQILYRALTYHATSGSGANSNLPTPAPIKAHLLSPADVFVAYSTDPKLGLDSAAVRRKAAKAGRNVLSPPSSKFLIKFLGYTFGGFNTLMWIAATLSIITYFPIATDAYQPLNLGVGILLMVVITVSTCFYAYVDWNASNVMKSIQSLVAHQVNVIRDGQEQLIDAETLVPGDVVILSMGQRVPADIRLIEVSSDLQFDRSLLTGESKGVNGTVQPTSESALETKNLALSSTFVLRGRACGIVFQIGDGSIIGQIIKMSSKQKTAPTAIQQELNVLSKVISIVAVSFFCLAMLTWGIWIRVSYPNYANAATAVINAIGCLTAFVPQGLPVCFALSLTIIARRMAARRVLVKNLSTIETLGCMSVLCSDKTGTLTLGRMVVTNAMFVDKTVEAGEMGSDSLITNVTDTPALQKLLMVASVCNDATFLSGNEKWPVAERPINGDPTDSAILRYAEMYRSLFTDDLNKYTTLFSMAFNSKNKFMAKIVRKGSEPPMLLVKGAPDILLLGCSRVNQSDGTISALEEQQKLKISAAQEASSSQGLRVLTLCLKSLDNVSLPLGNQDELEKVVLDQMKDLELVGMLALRDPPRADTLPTVKAMRKAGVRVFMVTGDFELTAYAIAKQVGIVTCMQAYRLHDLAKLKANEQWADCKRNPSQMRPRPNDPHSAIIINGPELEAIQETDWDYICTKFSEMVFARTTPEQKLLIVESLKKRGDNVVAVTGDGTNDAPALKAADIGVAMGAGSDVAKEAAAMILLDNDFSSLLVGIENGRLVFENLKKVCMYQLPTGTICEFMAVMSNVFFGMQIPLSPFLQVIFCVTNDILMSISLMFERAESDLMNRPPRNARTDRLADWRFFIQVYLVISPCTWLASMGMWFLFMSEQGIGFNDLMFAFDQWGEGWVGKTADELAEYVSTGQCIYYITMVVCQFGVIQAIRNRSVSILESSPLKGPRQNLAIFMAMAGSILIAIILLYGYWIQQVFSTTPIPAKFWFIPFGFAAGILAIDESRKAIVRAYPNSWLAKIAW